jgi:uncharacterized protein (TIGR02453 family)
MTFSGFGEYAIDFFDDLAADNSKVFWEKHKSTYQNDVRAPMEALLAELADEFGAGKVFRPYRDTRFAKDKTPYKTHCGGVIEHGRGGGAYYVEISSAGLRFGGGSYAMAADQLARYRTAVAGDLTGPALEKVLAKLTKAGWTVHGELLKTKPRGFDADHPRIELLRRRALYVVRSYKPDDVLHEHECLNRVRRGWREVRALNEWCADHIGISDRSW